ncbi:hypothetical protein BGX24_001528 [Mortierella sp. AD032]|nr:hypothetical protein BGX24_001528 [Mortierella sp. AD032]
MSTTDKPTVLIVGAGLGGLMLGALLEKSDVPYTIFERAAAVKSLGSAMSIGAGLLPAFEQMGLYDEILAIGKYWTHTEPYKESLEPYHPSDFSPVEEYTGYGQVIVTRPKFYEVMLKQVPPHKIHFGKRVLNITEEDDKVTVHLSNNETFKGDIVVGADGAYSAIRQRMYEQLATQDKLPKSDQEELPFSCTCLVGQTKVLDPKEFPIIDEPVCKFRSVKTAQEQRFRNNDNAEWGAHPAQTMCDETRNFPIELSDGKKRTLGDLYDLTPKELISKVMLEEKVFSTWYSGRVVLLGDACHKLNPSGGHGAVTAMHDAIALANLLYALPSKTSSDVTRIFQEYQEERYPAVIQSFKKSQFLSKSMEKGIMGTVFLYLTTRMPLWLWKIALAKMVGFRPQLGFVEAIAVKGTIAPVAPPSEQKARAVYEEKQRQQSSNVVSV